METFYAFLEEFERELTCSICEKTFTDPVTLPCLHSFCSKCLEQLCEKSNNTSVSCPYPACRSPFDVPGGNVSKLCSSFYLKALLKLIEVTGTKEKWEGQEMQHCGSCEKPTLNLEAFCQECNRVICNECVSAHKLLKRISEEHKVVMLNEINRDSVDDFIKNLVVCEEQSHENNKLEYFCFEETCKKYICLKCVAEDHKFHNFSSVDDAADKVKQSIKQCMTRADNLKQGYEEELLLSQQNLSRIRSEVEQAKKEVHDAVEAVIQQARQHEEAICQALDEILSKQQDANDGEQSDINTGINHLSEFNIHCQSLIDRNRKYEVIDVQDILKDKCEVALQRSTILSSKPIQRNARLRYVGQIPEVENMGEIVENLFDPSYCTIESLNDIRCGFENQFEIITRKAKEELCDMNIDFISVEVKDPDGNEIQAKLSMKEKGRFTVRYKAEKVGVCTVDVTIGGEQIKNSPRKVNTYDNKRYFVRVRTFSPVDENEELALKYPLSIAVNENGQIAIADREVDFIQMFDAEGEFIRKIKVKLDGKKFKPEGVLFVEDRRMIVTGKSDWKGEIVEIDLTDEQVRTIYRPYERFAPRGMCVTDENIIAVCYVGDEEHGINSGIKLFDGEGNFLREFRSPERNCKPCYVAYGNRKYFVSYYDETCIRVFDNDGVFLHKFGEEGQGGGQFDRVGGLILYDLDLILVCDHCNNRVQLLTQEGEFVTSFSAMMRRPVDLVVTPDGQVFVLNFASKQVQLWR